MIMLCVLNGLVYDLLYGFVDMRILDTIWIRSGCDSDTTWIRFRYVRSLLQDWL